MTIAIVIELLNALALFAPKVPEIVTGVDTAIRLLQSGKDPTAEEKATIDAALDAANKAIQDA